MIAVGGWICLFAPLAGAIADHARRTRISRRPAGWISTLSVFVGFAGALASFVAVARREPRRARARLDRLDLARGRAVRRRLQILVDPLSLMMMLIVTGVGGLIVRYSIGYMTGEDEERRYFAYMALFVFSMLMLVRAATCCSCSSAGGSSASPRTC